MDTKLVNVVISDIGFQQAYKKLLKDKVLKKFTDELSKILWVNLSDCYYVPEYGYIVGDPERKNFSCSEYPDTFYEMKTTLVSQNIAKELFYTRKSECPFIYGDCTKGSYRKRYITCRDGCIDIVSGVFKDWSMGDSDHLKIPFVKLKISTFILKLVEGTLKLAVDDINDKLFLIIKQLQNPNINEKWALKYLGISRESIMSECKNISLTNEDVSEVIENVLASDYTRVELEKYDAKCIDDVNAGHWELWLEDDNAEGVKLPRFYVARNPVSDVKHDGIVGIDFGTKSTIVSYMDGNDIKKLHRIGVGKLSQEAKASHYENPTVMEFRNIDSFMKAYKAQEGRPYTSLEDLTVSHKAYNSMKNSDASDLFYSFFYDIKQWCGDSSRYKQYKIIDGQRNEYVLSPYLELGEESMDPVEIYAYYLGLYINNMRNGIFLNYVLSFPVAYEKAVKEKLLLSFTKGLKKSLPDAVLHDEECMSRFKVVQGVSEPAAYAITALQSYGFDPEDENEKYFYGIFDFGGGTTDFDFGLWRGAASTREERRYNYVIEHFGAEGDQYLGGENLLELAAFEIFKANKEKLLKNEQSKGFTFFKPAECDTFPGSEALISNSQEAKRNLKQLMEKIRPLWEGLATYNEDSKPEDVVVNDNYVYVGEGDILSIGEISVDLFDTAGNRIQAVKLDVSDVDIVGIFEDRIEKGVKNFFEALKLTFKHHVHSDSEQIHIFLAGNSCKSPIVKHCFDEYITIITDEIGRTNECQYFILYPPLGTAEAIELQSAKGIQVSEDDLYAPTGKTGVALGLLEGRKGGPIKVVSEIKATDEAKFKYYVGINEKSKFIVVMNRDIEYNKWVNIDIPADEDEFEIYYTTLPEATTNSMKIIDAKKKRCLLSATDEAADIYIRAITPTCIEYCAACKSDIDREVYVSVPQTIDLSK